MKRIILLIAFVLVLSVPAWAQSTNRIILHSGATGAANGERPFGLSWNGGTITVSGTFTGLNAVAEISPDGSTFNTVSVTNLNGLTQSTTITAAGVYFMPIGRAYQFGVRVTAVTGTATIVITPTDQVLAKGSSGGAPSDATFITQTPSSTLTAEQALSALATGLLKNTTTTGVLSIAGASDLPSGIDAAKIADGSVSNAEFQRLDGVTSGIQAQIDSKQAAIGFTPEDVANKSTDGTLAGNSDTLYASQKATKTYADTKEVPLTFSSPLVRTVNAVACATCVIASSPGAGIAHFAGSTQTVTSSPIVNADIANSTIDLTSKVTGILPAVNGGTGVANNAASTITISGNFSTTFTVTGATNVTLPTSGTLATTANLAPFDDSTAIIKGSGDATKLLRFEVDGFTSSTTRVITPPDSNTSLPVYGATITYTGPTAPRTVTYPDSNFTVARTDAGQTFAGTQVIGGMSFAATNGITGGAGNMTITAGTGASRTIALQTTTSGGVATTALTLGSDQSATFVGNVSVAGFTANNYISMAGSIQFAWNNRSSMRSPSDGVITMTNAAEADFSRLNLGGNTSSFPALKRSSTTVAFRLADDSADAPISASTVNATTGFRVNSAATLGNVLTGDGTNFVSAAPSAIAGGSSSTVKLGGALFDHYADVSTTHTDGTEDDLYSDSVPASTLNTNGHKLRSVTYVNFISSATASRRLKAYFGGTNIFDSGALTLSLGGDFWVEALIIRESSTVVRAVVTVTTTSASSVPYVTYTRITGLTLTNANTLKTTGIAAGTGAASGDIAVKSGFVEFLPAQ